MRESIAELLASPVPALLHDAGSLLYKSAESSPEIAMALSGQLYAASTNEMRMAVPIALVRGIFSAMREPGVTAASLQTEGELHPHVTALSAEEVEDLGGKEKIRERGKQFGYTLGRLRAIDTPEIPGVARVWYLVVHSPELQELRRSYGLSSLPGRGADDFHVVVAVRKSGVLSRNATRQI